MAPTSSGPERRTVLGVPLPAPDGSHLPLSLREMAGRMGWSNVVSGVVPVATFMPLDWTYGLRWAMAGATAASVTLGLARRARGRRPGLVLWISLAFLVARGAVGVATNSELAYFGPGIVTSFLVAAIFLGSVAVGRPAIGAAFKVVFGPPDPRSPPDDRQRIFRQLSLVWGIYSLASGILQIWLLRTVSAGTYIAVRQATNLAGTVPMIAGSLYRIRGLVTRPAPETAA
ncbi:MAG TPA: DUF3159 domain-containing protein [Acidimicrobiales bacterium]|nr:DUF3159 domain-containing protein [Acidimicrobiales bacterium]